MSLCVRTHGRPTLSHGEPFKGWPAICDRPKSRESKSPVTALYVIRARDGVARLTHDKAFICARVASAYSDFSFIGFHMSSQAAVRRRRKMVLTLPIIDPPLRGTSGVWPDIIATVRPLPDGPLDGPPGLGVWLNECRGSGAGDGRLVQRSGGAGGAAHRNGVRNGLL